MGAICDNETLHFDAAWATCGGDRLIVRIYGGDSLFFFCGETTLRMIVRGAKVESLFAMHRAGPFAILCATMEGASV